MSIYLSIHLSIYLSIYPSLSHIHISCPSVLGNPIANDPCYGGELFYNDAERRMRAIEVLRGMRRDGKHPLSKVPHLGDPELDNLPPPVSVPAPLYVESALVAVTPDLCEVVSSIDNSVATSLAVEVQEEKTISLAVDQAVAATVVQSSSDPVDTVQSDVKDDDSSIILPNKVESEEQGETESDHEYLVRTCR